MNASAEPFIPSAASMDATATVTTTSSKPDISILGDDILSSLRSYLGDENLALVLTRIAEPDKEMLEYPFAYISSSTFENSWGPTYNINDFAGGILGEEKCDCGNFPENITEYYWIHEGKNDEEPWMCLCRLDNGCYAFYSASCDYTGFYCQGGMKLIVSKDIKKLFYEGMYEGQRKTCIKDKKAGNSCAKYVPEPEEDDMWPIPVVPEHNTVNPTKAFIRVWEDDKELILNLNHTDGMMMEDLEYAIRGLTAQFLTPKPDTSAAASVGAGSSAATKKAPKPKKKFYTVRICTDTSVVGIDDYFKKRFGNPNKKWTLRMDNPHKWSDRKWGKVEVSFILY